MHLIADNGSGWARTRAADADLGIAVHGPEDGDRLAHPGLDHTDGNANERLGTGAAAVDVHIEVEPDTEIASDKRRKGWIVAGVR